MRLSLAVHAIATFFALIWSTIAFGQAADLVLTNGKIVTVNDQFATVQALAIKSERIVAVGRDADIDKFRGPATRLMDLQGRTVIPGLIDNHAHYMRAAEYWHREVRLDGVTSHKRAIELIQEKVRELKPGEWVVVLGGSRKSNDGRAPGVHVQGTHGIAPENPVALQLFYFRVMQTPQL